MGRFREELRSAVRPRRAADLVLEGVSRRSLEGPRWFRTSYGFYRPATSEEATTTQRILDVAAQLPPGGLIGGWAAAYASGADLLDGRDHVLRPMPVPVLLPPGSHRVSNAAVTYVQRSARSADRVGVRMIAGVPCTQPLQTATDLTRWAAGLVEAVVALDIMLAARLITKAGLATAAPTGSSGATQARRAIALSRPGVRSPWETRLRMFWVLDLGLPPPLVNRAVFDRHGRFLGVPDLLDVEAGLAIEYDGVSWRSTTTAEGHRDPDQHRADNVREESLERAGLIVVRADKVDLTRERPRLARRLLAARAEGLRRSPTGSWTVKDK